MPVSRMFFVQPKRVRRWPLAVENVTFPPRQIEFAQTAFTHILPVTTSFVMTKTFKPSNVCAPVSGAFDFIE